MSEQLLRAMNGVDPAFIAESAKVRRRSPIKLWGAAAACLALLVAAGSMLPQAQPPVEPLPPSVGDVQPLEIDLGQIHVFPIDAMADYSRLYRDPALYDEVKWGAAELKNYYGWYLTPAYIPEGLSPSFWNSGATVWYDKQGNIAEDITSTEFYHAYYPDHSPMLTEDVAAVRGFSLVASRLGIVHCCYILLSDDAMQPTQIAGTEVQIGYRSMPYGPYDPETHAPSGYYDVYVAQFTLEGVEYELTSDQLPLEEVVKITASIISGRADVETVGTLDPALCGVPSAEIE